MRTHYCGVVTSEFDGQTVELCGWVHRRRDHGGVIFIDLRDREGLVQVVIDPDTPEIFSTAERVRSEYVLRIKGRVRPRPEGTTNKDLTTGEIEILAKELEVLNAAQTPPFPLDGYVDVNEDTRLRYRYMDLRRPQMLDRIRVRAKTVHQLRTFLEGEGFYDIETPMLTKATPEGARDYLVPSRTHPGSFFALPQSPQLFKQLLMMSGMDRYYQVVKCFRDEDLRADRQPEFTQLDLEMSFIDEDDIMNMMERMIRELFKTQLNVDLPNPFPRMTYAEGMRRFGSDRPDMRNPLELIDLDDVMKDVEFKVFAAPAKDPGSRVAAMNVPGGSGLSRKDIDGYTKFVAQYGARGLAYIKVNDTSAGRDGLQSPIVKNLSDDAITAIMQRTAAKDGDLIFFGADTAKVVNEALGALRDRIGKDRDLLKGDWEPIWIVDFPMFEYDEREKRWAALHHPFTAPSCSAEDLKADPGNALSRAYDMVLNGSEIGGGSIRIHDPDMQSTVFNVLGIGEEEAGDKFGFLLDALQYGCPPHGGLAFGMDRLVMLMTGSDSIREVMAFPKTQTAHCPLTNAPAQVADAQLRDLNIKLRKRPGDEQQAETAET